MSGLKTILNKKCYNIDLKMPFCGMAKVVIVMKKMFCLI